MLPSTALMCALAAFGSLSSATPTRSSKGHHAGVRRDFAGYTVSGVTMTDHTHPDLRQGNDELDRDQSIGFDIGGATNLPNNTPAGPVHCGGGRLTVITVGTRDTKVKRDAFANRITCARGDLDVSMLSTSSPSVPLGWYLTISVPVEAGGAPGNIAYWIPSSNSTNGPVSGTMGARTLTALPSGI